MFRKIIKLVSLALLLTACGGSTPGAKITSVKYIESIHTSGGVSYTYQGKEIIEMTLDFTFNESITSDLDPTSEDFRDQIYDILVKGTHFYYQDEEVEHTYGYWPQEAGKDFAKEMTLFYVVPSGHTTDDLRFVYDGSVLSENAKSIDTEIQPSR